MKPRIISPETEREETIAYLEFESVVWVQLRDRALRTDNRDAALVGFRDQSMTRLNHLLEDYFRQTVVCGVEHVEA